VPDLEALVLANARRWGVAKPTRNFASVAKALVATKGRYQTVERQTGVPWYFVAVVHEREASQNFRLSLAQGDPWNEVSVHVPVGRGPFNSWEAAAVDALVNCAPFAARNKVWSAGSLLTMCERYNGLGYASRGIPSPYVWSGTDQYQVGKFVRDGVFDGTVVDSQLGCAGLLMAMMKLDPSIDLTHPTVTPPQPVPAPTPTVPSVIQPAPGSIGDFIAKLFKAIAGLFKRK
jgi:lysozyme family protein